MPSSSRSAAAPFLSVKFNNSKSDKLCLSCRFWGVQVTQVFVCRPSGLPEDFSSKDYRPSSGPYCFIEQLCELHDGLVLEAKGVKEHFWKPFIKKLFHKRVRRLNQPNDLQIVSLCVYLNSSCCQRWTSCLRNVSAYDYST